VLQFDPDEGIISGYGAYFSNIDSHGDVIQPGAFKDSIARANKTGRFPQMLLMHSRGPLTADELPVGVWTSIFEDAKGLFVTGRLALGNSVANDVYSLLKSDPPAITGLSIGFIPSRFVVKPKGSDVKRSLIEIDLKEISIVTSPSNDKARILSVRTAATKRKDTDDNEISGLLRTLSRSIRSATAEMAQR
jgi:HK97 family phage prohead protease